MHNGVTHRVDILTMHSTDDWRITYFKALTTGELPILRLCKEAVKESNMECDHILHEYHKMQLEWMMSCVQIKQKVADN